MKQKILTIVALMTLTLTPTVIFSSPAYAADPSCGKADSAAGKVNQGIGQAGDSCDDSAVTKAIQAIIKIISYIAGIVAIIMIIISGFKFMTSGGDSGKVASARNALIYALIGVAVVVLAQFMVHFVFTEARNATTTTTTKKKTP